MADAATVTHRRGEFAIDFLRAIGRPASKENIIAIIAWQLGEGTSARFNPMATTWPMPGAKNFNSVGVKSYAKYEDGVTATASTILHGAASYGYGAILQALDDGTSAEAVGAAIVASSWGTTTVPVTVVRGDLTRFAEQPIGSEGGFSTLEKAAVGVDKAGTAVANAGRKISHILDLGVRDLALIIVGIVLIGLGLVFLAKALGWEDKIAIAATTAAKFGIVG